MSDYRGSDNTTKNYEKLYDVLVSSKKHWELVKDTAILTDIARKIIAKKKYKKHMIVLSAIIVILIILSTIILGANCFPDLGTYQYEELINGKDVVCYVTDSGNCYHNRWCGYLKSVNETTMYKAEKSGYSPCSACWSYPKAIYQTVTKTNYFKKYGTILFWVFICYLVLFIVISIIIRKKYKERIEKSELQLKEEKKDLLSEIIDTLGKEEEFIEAAKYYSDVPNDINYIDGLPTTEDNRYIVYQNEGSEVYHSKKECRGYIVCLKIHLFSALKHLRPCSFCAQYQEIPEWHEKFIKLYKLYKETVKMCE